MNDTSTSGLIYIRVYFVLRLKFVHLEYINADLWMILRVQTVTTPDRKNVYNDAKEKKVVSRGDELPAGPAVRSEDLTPQSNALAPWPSRSTLFLSLSLYSLDTRKKSLSPLSLSPSLSLALFSLSLSISVSLYLSVSLSLPLSLALAQDYAG